VSQKSTNFETTLFKIIRIYFDSIWQKYALKILEFVCFGLKHVNSILESFEHFSQISSKSTRIISRYTKLVHFLRQR